MADIQTILQEADFNKIITTLCVDTIDNRNPREYLEEYNGDRTRRTTSVGNRKTKTVTVYSDTLTDADGNPLPAGEETIFPAKIITNIPKKIVRFSAAFLFGGKMKITAPDPNDSYQEFKRIYDKKLKMRSVLKQFARTVMTETKAALIFYPIIKDTPKGKIAELKVKLLHLPKKSDAVCEFYPHFDDDSDMDAFIHKYQSEIEGKTRECIRIYTADSLITSINMDGSWEQSSQPNLFGKIPVVYADKDMPEWEDIVSTMDALEMRLSRLCDTNDYFAEPILKTFGNTSLPSKSTVGKQLEFEMTIDDNGEHHGDAEYLAWQQSVDSLKLELDHEYRETHSGASQPDLSFDNLKGLGNVSGTARRFMLIDAEVKADENMEIFEPVIRRTISIVVAGIANITNVKLAGGFEDNDIEVEFGSILPEDLKEELENLSIANGGQPINAKRTITANSPFTKNVDEEMKALQEEQAGNRDYMTGITI